MWLNRQVTTDLVTFAEEIFNEKLHFLCSVNIGKENQRDKYKGIAVKHYIAIT